MNWFNGSVLH